MKYIFRFGLCNCLFKEVYARHCRRVDLFDNGPVASLSEEQN